MKFKTNLGSIRGLSNQVPSNFPKSRNKKVSNPRSQRGKGGDSPSKKPACTKCGKKHMCECLVRTNNYFGCVKSVHKVRDCPNTKVQE